MKKRVVRLYDKCALVFLWRSCLWVTNKGGSSIRPSLFDDDFTNDEGQAMRGGKRCCWPL